MSGKSGIIAAELQNHSSEESCWLIVNGVVWDLTEFAPEHPGGAESKSPSREDDRKHKDET